MPTNLWQPGVSGNPAGRLRGSRNKLSEEVICALLRDFRKHGEKAVAKVRRTQPAAYLKICVLAIVREHKVEYNNTLKNMSDEELEATIEYVRGMLAAQAAEGATVIEGVADTAALPAPALEEPHRLLERGNTAIGPKERTPRKRVPSPSGA